MIRVSNTQRGNGLLNHLGVYSWSYVSGTITDYEINYSVSVLFLSLKFHIFKPEYIYKKINKLQESKLKVLLVLIDVPNYNLSLQELFSTIPIVIILCKSFQECAYYIKGFDKATIRSIEGLRRRSSGVDIFLEAIPKLNKTDCTNLKNSFGSLREIFKADEQKLSKIPGMGQIKAKSLLKYFKIPFKKQHCGSSDP